MGAPSGLAGARGDFAHYCRVHGANDALSRLLLPLRQPALLALWTYRYGRWVQHDGKPRLRLLHRALYRLFFELARHVSGVLIANWMEVAEEVWIESHHPAIVCGYRIGKGSFLFGGVTLGVAGREGGRGLPSVGERVVLGPGVVCAGPIEIPSGSVLGPNSVLMRSLPKEGAAWLGVPAEEYAGPRETLIPRIGGMS